MDEKKKILNETPTSVKSSTFRSKTTTKDGSQGNQIAKSQLGTNSKPQPRPIIKNQPTINASDQLKQTLKETTLKQPQSSITQPQMRKGASQFNPVLKEQKFTPPATPSPTPLSVPPPALPSPLTPPQKPLPQMQPEESPKQEFLEPKPKRPLPIKLLISLIFLLIFVILGSSLTLAYTNYPLIPLPKSFKNVIESAILVTPLPKTPRMIINKTVGNMSEVETATLKTEVAISTADSNIPIKSLKLTVTGPAEFQNRNQKRSEANIALGVETEGLKLSGSGSVKMIGDTLYFKITEFPAGSFLPADSFKNQWYFAEIPNLQSKIYAEDPQKIKARQEVLEKFLEKSYQWSKKVASADNLTHTLKISPPQKEIETLVHDFIKTLDSETQTELEESLTHENISKALSYLQNTQVQLVIDKKDYLFDEIALAFNINIDSPPDLSGSSQITLPAEKPVKIDVAISSKFSDYNKPVIVEIPENAKDVSEILESFLDFYNNLNLQNTTLPHEEKPQSIQNLLDSSEVLGQRTYWDLRFLQFVKDLTNNPR